jgi:hypothetical protein
LPFLISRQPHVLAGRTTPPRCRGQLTDQHGSFAGQARVSEDTCGRSTWSAVTPAPENQLIGIRRDGSFGVF